MGVNLHVTKCGNPRAERLVDEANDLVAAGRHGQAAARLRRAIRLDPSNSWLWNALGVAYACERRLPDAIRAFGRFVEKNPGNTRGLLNLGSALFASGDQSEALDCFLRALAAEPGNASAYAHIGLVHQNAKRFSDAVRALEAAVSLDPQNAPICNNLAIVYMELNRWDDAERLLEMALRNDPLCAEAWLNRAVLGSLTGQEPSMMLASLEQALAIDPHYAAAHFIRAHTRLQSGDFEHGWPEFEWRLQYNGEIEILKTLREPPWRGWPLLDQTLLVYCEQGLGDTIQFIRYLRFLRSEKRMRLVICCRQELVSLLSYVFAQHDVVVAYGSPLPPFDCWLPLASLPGIVGTNLQTIPSAIPYLKVSPAQDERWRNIIAPEPGRLRVGIHWQGNGAHLNDRRRSIPLALWEPLLRLPHVRFYSLQKGEPLPQDGTGRHLTDLSPMLETLEDTAGCITKLDLVIAIDSVVAHLAGALGVRVWTLLPFNSDWRWLRERTDSPWYPSMRLFRQERIDSWDEVISRVAACLGPSEHRVSFCGR